MCMNLFQFFVIPILKYVLEVIMDYLGKFCVCVCVGVCGGGGSDNPKPRLKQKQSKHGAKWI
jgi:hypothetical protein